MAFKVKKVKPSRFFQTVVEQIETAIIGGDLRPGDVLPSEMKLKEMFETSRGTIREALRVLEQKGLVDIRTGQGGGARVKALEADKITESLNLFVQTRNISFDHLSEFREGVEGMVTALAAERATEADIERLKAILDEAEVLMASNPPDWRRFTRLDVRLHIAVAEISGNPIFAAVHRMIHDNVMGIDARYSLFLSHSERLRENYRDLCGIVAAIEARDAGRARLLAQDHVRKSTQRMKEANPGIHSDDIPG